MEMWNVFAFLGNGTLGNGGLDTPNHDLIFLFIPDCSSYVFWNKLHLSTQNFESYIVHAHRWILHETKDTNKISDMFCNYRLDILLST
jgi:hypothetical protein